MKKETLANFREMFLQQAADLKKKLSAAGEEFDIEGDEIDQASGATLCRVAQDLSNRSAIQLRNVEAALARIEDGSFGECEECGEDISEKRLLAKSDATTCILCAEKLEKEAKQYGVFKTE